MKRPGPHFQVIRLVNDAALISPESVESKDQASILPNPSPLLDVRTHQMAEARVGAAEAAEARAAALVAQAEGKVAQARVEAERSRDLVTRGAAPHSRLEHDELALQTESRELEALNSALHATKHEVEAARAALLADDTSREGVRPWPVRSPVTGRVLRILQKSQGDGGCRRGR